MNADVEKAVEDLDSLHGLPEVAETIRQGLRDQEAAIVNLRSAGQKALMANVELRIMAEQADALLRHIVGCPWFVHRAPGTANEIDAHLGAKHE